MPGHNIPMCLCRNPFLWKTRSVAPHRPVNSIMISEVGVLMDMSSAFITNIANDGVFRWQVRKFRKINGRDVISAAGEIEHCRTFRIGNWCGDDVMGSDADEENDAS